MDYYVFNCKYKVRGVPKVGAPLTELIIIKKTSISRALILLPRADVDVIERHGAEGADEGRGQMAVGDKGHVQVDGGIKEQMSQARRSWREEHGMGYLNGNFRRNGSNEDNFGNK